MKQEGETVIKLMDRNSLAFPHADLEKWKAKHPRASKSYPFFFVDFLIEGSKESNPAGYSWSSIVWLIKERDNKICRVCGSNGSSCKRFIEREIKPNGNEVQYFTEGIEVQHIIPRKDGGSNHPHNLITLCRRCHLLTFKEEYSGIPFLNSQTRFIASEDMEERVKFRLCKEIPLLIECQACEEQNKHYLHGISQKKIEDIVDGVFAFIKNKKGGKK